MARQQSEKEQIETAAILAQFWVSDICCCGHARSEHKMRRACAGESHECGCTMFRAAPLRVSIVIDQVEVADLVLLSVEPAGRPSIGVVATTANNARPRYFEDHPQRQPRWWSRDGAAHWSELIEPRMWIPRCKVAP